MTQPARSLILASQSPRRLALLREHGYDVEVIPSRIDESWPDHISPAEAVIELASRKATTVAHDYPERPVLGADTAVILNGESLGKPATRSEAAAMLKKLSGQTHVVFSGVALVQADISRTGYEESHVTFRTLSAADIERYLDAAAYTDKAGAYGIQEEGNDLVASYTGRFDTIVGLPMNIVESLWEDIARAA